MKTTAPQSGCAGCHSSRGCAALPVARAGGGTAHRWLDRFFLHPRWGFAGSLAVFALVLVVVFKVSAWIDAHTTARLAEAIAGWEPAALPEVIAKAIVDGLVGLAGIAIPYMIPLVALLVALEQAGIMPRIALVIDRAFHRIGLHGGVAVAFLTGLGCNVPAIASAAHLAAGRQRVIASFLITFVPCSARSAIVLAVGGKYLGAWGVLAIFGASIAVIALLGRVLSSRRSDLDPGRVHAVAPYAIPRLRDLLGETWLRSRDVLTIVTPLLVLGSVVLSLLGHVGGDRFLNALLAPVTAGWLGVPVALGVPLVFGALRKELSLLMIFQALGTSEIGAILDAQQLTSLLLFVTFYVPCLATFAAMVRTLGRHAAFVSAGLSITVALAASGAARAVMAGIPYFAGWLA